jgi:hypothetical protein
VLYYGAAPDEENGLSAHVWIRDGHVEVIGSEIAYRLPSWRCFRRKTRRLPAADGASSAHGI